MNYFVNGKYNLIKLIQGSIILAYIIPLMNKPDSTKAMFKTAIQKTSSTLTPKTTPSISGVKSLVGMFENISNSNQNKPKSNIKSNRIGFNYLNPPQTSSKIYTSKLSTSNNTANSTQNFKSTIQPQKTDTSKLPTIITGRGFTYLYGDDSSSNNKTSTNTRNTTISSSPKTAKSSDIFGIYTSSTTSTLSELKSNKTDNPTTSSKYIQANENPSSTSTYTLKLGGNPNSGYPALKFSKQQMNELESMIKAKVTTVVNQNLPDGFPRNQPITVQFDQKSGRQLNKSLNNFLYFSAIKTLELINKE